MTASRLILAIVVVTLACVGGLLFFAEPAYAQAAGSVGNFSCSGGKAIGSLYSSKISCPTTLQFSNIFSFLVCNMEQLSSNLLGNMFCGMTANLAPAVSAVLVLAVVFFGIGFTIGVIPATARDFQMFLIKVVFVWTFATQSDYLIGYGYGILISGIRDGVAIALTGYNDGTAASGPAVYGQLDFVLSTLIHYGTDYMGVTKSNAADVTNMCKNALFAALAVMAIAMPPLFLLGIGLFAKLVMVFVRAVFGYVYALVGIAFLMTLAPFFLSFFLFRQTRPFFDKWTGYLVSFALQIVILFAFLSFILSINVKNMTDHFTDLIIPVMETPETTTFRAPWTYCTVCKFEIVDAKSGKVLSEKDTEAFANGKPRCIQENGKTVPIPLLAASAPEVSSDATKQQMGILFKFVGGVLMSLLVLAFVVQGLLDYLASLAQMLASGIGGASYATQLGGGQSFSGRPTMGMPFQGVTEDAARGFQRGYNSKPGKGEVGTAVGAATRGFKDATSTLLHGDDRAGSTGMKNRFLDWLADPNQIDRH